MTEEIKLHYFQKELIKKLTLLPEIRFNSLIIEGLESEHMNYHLKKLVEIGLVNKTRQGYTLSDAGKDFSNLLDDDLKTVEKQPKTSIIIRGIQTNADGEIEHLLCRRLRQPYFGKVGRLTGKVHFGEKLAQAAARELYEETGMTAKNFQLENIYRKIRQREDEAYVQDVIFFTLLVTDFMGNLIVKTPFQENFWITAKELSVRDDLDLYEDFELLDFTTPRPLELRESVDIAQGY
jgi:ADP-ribose pyrophosphatase YjhB (NUDIX family)